MRSKNSNVLGTAFSKSHLFEDDMTKPIRPMGRSINDSTWKRVLRGVAATVATVAFGALLGLVLLEWMAGCGETYVDSKGERHAHECIFIR